jgi:type IV secretory pathway ATPase VirB11/archaellum biosynthesis ATPase
MNLGSMIQEHRMRADGAVRLLNQEPDTMRIDIESIKRDAKRISRATTVTHSQALDVLAVQNGFTHWGAWLTRIETEIKKRSEAFADGTTPSALMSRVVQNWDWSGHPMLSGTRHLMASGAASTGKTTITSRLAQNGPEGVPAIMCGEDRDDVRTTADLRKSTRRGTGRGGCYETVDYEEALKEAVDLRAGIIVFGDVTDINADTVLKAMQLGHAPTVIATINASSVDHARGKWSAFEDAGMIPPGSIMLIQMGRDIHGNRRITDIETM